MPSIHLELLSFFYENIKEIALVHYYNKNCTILFDEGLFHNFSDCLLDLHHTNNEKFNSVISNTAIVFCKASPETIAHHILERNRLFSILHSFHQNKNFVELIEYQINSLKLIDSRIEFFKHCNIPILEINTSDDLKKNAIKVNEFIKKHSK